MPLDGIVFHQLEVQTKLTTLWKDTPWIDSPWSLNYPHYRVILEHSQNKRLARLHRVEKSIQPSFFSIYTTKEKQTNKQKHRLRNFPLGRQQWRNHKLVRKGFRLTEERKVKKTAHPGLPASWGSLQMVQEPMKSKGYYFSVKNIQGPQSPGITGQTQKKHMRIKVEPNVGAKPKTVGAFV